jgi:WD40 repeat protein
VQFSNNSDWIAASTEGQVWLLNYKQSGTLTVDMKAAPDFTPSGSVIDLVTSADANWLAASTEGGQVFLYDVRSKTSRVITSTNTEKKTTFSSDSSLLIIGDSDGNTEAFNLATNETITLYKSDSRVTSLATSDMHVAIGLLDKIVLIDPNTGDIVSEMESPGDHAHTAFNADGSIFAASNSSGQIHIWKKRGSAYTLLLTIPLEQVFSMTFNPQADQLVVGVLNYVYILDPDSGNELSRIRHKDIVSGLSFSPDGSILATASLKAIQFWNVEKIAFIPSDELETAACARLTKNFDAAQWIAFFGEEEYRKLCDDLP